MGSHRTGAGQSLVAIDGFRCYGRTVDIDFAKKPGAHPLLALAGSVGEIPDSFLVADRHGKPSGMAARVRRNKRWIVFCDGGGQPTFYAGNDGDVTGHFLDSFFESDPFASSVSCRSVALWIRGGPLRMVRAVAAGFRSRAGSGAIARRTRSGSFASAGAYWRGTEADRDVSLAGFFGAGDLRLGSGQAFDCAADSLRESAGFAQDDRIRERSKGCATGLRSAPSCRLWCGAGSLLFPFYRGRQRRRGRGSGLL